MVGGVGGGTWADVVLFSPGGGGGGGVTGADRDGDGDEAGIAGPAASPVVLPSAAIISSGTDELLE